MLNEFIIGVDVDGVLADFISFMLKIHNMEYDKQSVNFTNGIYKKIFKVEDITTHCLESHIGTKAWDDLFIKLNPYEFVKYLPLYDGAKDAVNELRKIGKVVFVTAPCWKYSKWVPERFEWLQEHFNCTEQDVIFTHNKAMFAGDMLIDDNPAFLESWKKDSIKVLRPWNETYEHKYSTNDWEEIIHITKHIKQKILTNK